MPTIPDQIAKRAIFVQEFKSVVETRSVWSPVATKLVSTAKNVQSPFISIEAAKAHTQPCKVPLSELTVNRDELVLDRYVGNAITDCEDELSYANFDILGMIRRDLYASVIKKLNIEATKDFVADADTVSGTVDLSTPAKVSEFLITVAADAESDVFSLSQSVDGATVKRAEKHGLPFVAAGRDAFIKIQSSVSSLIAQSSTKGLYGKDIIETPHGVVVINLGSSADNAKRLVYGVAGVPTMAYRADQINVDMGEMVHTTTYDEASPDLDLENGDPLLSKRWYIYAQTRGKNGIFSNVQKLVKTQLMA